MKRNIFIVFVIYGFLMTGCNQTASIESSRPVPTRINTITPTKPTGLNPSQGITITPTKSTNFADMVYFRTNERSEEYKIFVIDSDLNTVNSYPDLYSDLFLSSVDCNLLSVFVDSGIIEITSLSPDGELVETRTIHYVQDSIEELYQVTISPLQDWVSFKQVSHDYQMFYDTAKTQNIKLVKIDENASSQNPITLTERGGATESEAMWSPDGRFIAFTDYDKNDLMQVFIYSPSTSNKSQITRFSQKHIVSRIKWSPDSTMIALAINDTETGDFLGLPISGYIELFHLPDFTSEIILPEKADQTKLQFWWSEENQLLILAGSLLSSGIDIFWYNTATNLIERKLESDFFNPKYLNYAYPLTNDLKKIGIVVNPVLIYDYENNTFFPSSNKELINVFFMGGYKLIETSSGFPFFPRCQ